MTVVFTKGEAEVLGLNRRASKLTVPMQKNRTSQGVTPLPHPDLAVRLCGGDSGPHGVRQDAGEGAPGVTMSVTPDCRDTLECMIGEHGIGLVIDLLAVLCTRKAEHVRSNWPDRVLADAWDDIAESVSGLDASDML